MNRLLPALLAAAILALGMPGRAQAQAPSPTTERQRLRSELDRVNAEIDRLKQPDRGVRDDYRLRQRMADAEALARRLTELEARTGTAGSPRAAGIAPAPAAAPGDGPAELEAKADVLTDQARRLASQAEALEARSAKLQARQELRRRSSQMDRDPLSPFDGSKRRMVSSLAASATTPNSATAPQDKAGTSGMASPTPIVTPGRPEVSYGSGETPVLSTSMTAQFRDYLDPSTLADIRRIESSRGPGWEAQAMRRTAEALRSRSAELGRTADSLRKQARR